MFDISGQVAKMNERDRKRMIGKTIKENQAIFFEKSYGG